ncbi:hypothetical protein Mal33_22470 [Rosistilla oblonga]|uniref:Uncharacterized protein n=1 Tax=Rosistilla oblonga TaxID=2527990 RepID=A0A518IT51_9BACT|nr:hypothetical protein Mal33_22470 [Rosistilla oblonga]
MGGTEVCRFDYQFCGGIGLKFDGFKNKSRCNEKVYKTFVVLFDLRDGGLSVRSFGCCDEPLAIFASALRSYCGGL